MSVIEALVVKGIEHLREAVTAVVEDPVFQAALIENAGREQGREVLRIIRTALVENTRQLTELKAEFESEFVKDLCVQMAKSYGLADVNRRTPQEVGDRIHATAVAVLAAHREWRAAGGFTMREVKVEGYSESFRIPVDLKEGRPFDE